MTRALYEQLTGVSRSQAAYDLANLVDAGILVRVGAGRATRYRLARAARPERRHWTSDQIRAELTAFCAGRTAWPSPAEFRSAGRSGLYIAASRYGGTAFWAAELGLSYPERRRQAEREPVRPRRRIVPLLAAALLAGGAVAAAAVAVALRPSERRPESTAAPRTRVPIAEDAAQARRAAAAERPAADGSASAVSLVLRASHGASRISIRTGAGRLLYAGTLARRRRLEVQGKALWLRLGAPANVVASVDGRRARRLPMTAVGVVVTARGIRVVERKQPKHRPGVLVTRTVAPTVSAPPTTHAGAATSASAPVRMPSTSGPAPLPAPAAAAGPAPLTPP